MESEAKDHNADTRGRDRGLADAAGLLAFVVLGLHFHNLPITADAVLRTAAPLWAAWFALAAALRTYRNHGWTLFVANWILAVPIGLLARQVILGKGLGRGTLVFVAVALPLSLAVLTASRAGMALLMKARPRAERFQQNS